MAAVGYAKDADGNELYKTNNSNDEIIEHGRYAQNKHGQEYYPKKADNNEYRDITKPYIKRDGEYVLPLSNTGEPLYDKDANNADIYTMYEGKYIFGVARNGRQQYVLKSNGDECYPPDNSTITLRDGTKLYALSTNGGTIFPKDANQNEFYLSHVNPNNSKTIPTRYALDKDQNPIYPKTKTVDGFESDYLLNDYAVFQNAKIYPKDAFNNEFYLSKKKADRTARTAQEILPAGLRYAVTNDLKIILPEVGDTHHIDATGGRTAVVPADIIGKLVRESGRTSGFLTTKDSNKVITKPEARAYRYVTLQHGGSVHDVTPPGSVPPVVVADPGIAPGVGSTATTNPTIVPFYKGWCFWVFVIISLIVKAFAVWWFFLQNQKYNR